ncbi:MAG TPA: UPF0182 family protein [Vicinamibacteria bacterium]|nr:UPF0182 family protein [Vicinamibacteria bacterium]
MRAPSSRLWLLLLAGFVMVGLPALVELYSDWLWYGETGYRPVFLRSLALKAGLGLAAGLFAFAFLAVNLRIALRDLRSHEYTIQTELGPRLVRVDAGTLKALVTLAAAVAGILTSVYAASQWERFLLFWYATPFERVDPVLGHDVGYYVFRLPFLMLLRGLLQVVSVLALVSVVAAYLLTGAIGIGVAATPFAAPAAVRHLSALCATMLLVLAFDAHLSVREALTEASGIVHGASNTDVAALIPSRRLLALTAVAAAILAAAQGFSRSFRPIFAAVALYALVALAGKAYAAAVQRFLVAPNEQAKETPYIRHNIAGTRAGFGLDTVQERELPGDAPLTLQDIERNAATLKNVPLWDHRPLLDTFGQIQEIRTYYDFVSVHNDRYRIGGEQRQVMLSARELNSGSLPNRTWINEHLTFTHGYGLALGPVNQVTPEGLPVLFVKNLPPESSVPELQVSEPSIYFGELSNDHVFVRTKTKEFHYPKGDDNVMANYEGSGGVAVDSFLRKLLFALRFRSLKVLLSDDFTADSRVLFHRRVAERVRRIAPFLDYDPEPYLALSGGRLVWIQDAYTTSAHYPYSTPMGRINYIRNSVKATIDAYHGRVAFFLIDAKDPIAGTLGKAFPGLFRPLADMPEDLRERLRYPEAIFALQAAAFSTFHMTNPAVFYNKEDQWEVPSLDDGAGRPEPMQPYYAIMKLPGEQAAEFIQMLPFTPRQKDNLAAWMVARSDGENYGKLTVFQFPKQKVVFGPRQVVARINQDQTISPQITLWNQQGSQVIQGTLLVIPIEESLLYIRPLYLRAAGGRIPELKRVIVAHQNQIVMEETLDAALQRLFAAGSRPARPAAAEPVATTAPAQGPADLALRAREHYLRALEAQRAGDWARYGEEIKRLGETLEQMNKR